MKFKKYLEEKTNIPPGLLQWVKDYQKVRKAGNARLAKQVKDNIDKEIKKKKLNKNDVYSVFGDPDKKE